MSKFSFTISRIGHLRVVTRFVNCFERHTRRFSITHSFGKDGSAMTFDLRDPQFVSWLSPHAEWKRELIRHFARKYQIPGFIETGTCWGTTVGAVLNTLQKIASVEVSEPHYLFAVKK